MSTASPELMAIADRVIAQAGKGEQIEAYVARGQETDIRIYEGEVEHFVSAQSEGIGIRVIRDGRCRCGHDPACGHGGGPTCSR